MLLIKLLLLLSQPQEQHKTESHDSCGSSPQAKALAQLIRNDNKQQRVDLLCNEELAEIAGKRAAWLANNPYEEDSANRFVHQHGFRLPDYYPVTGNQIESYTHNHQPVSATFKELINSNKHRAHVLGHEEFFGLQDQIGVGYYVNPNHPGQSHWVVLIAASWQPPKIKANFNFNYQWKQPKGCDKDWKNSKDAYLKKKCSSTSSR